MTAAHTTRYDLQADMAATSWRAVSVRRTAAHTARYDLQADMVAVSFSTDGADHGGRVCSMAWNQDGGVIINKWTLLLITAVYY